MNFYQKNRAAGFLSDAACTNSRNSRNRILCDQLQHSIFFSNLESAGEL